MWKLPWGCLSTNVGHFIKDTQSSPTLSRALATSHIGYLSLFKAIKMRWNCSLSTISEVSWIFVCPESHMWQHKGTDCTVAGRLTGWSCHALALRVWLQFSVMLCAAVQELAPLRASIALLCFIERIGAGWMLHFVPWCLGWITEDACVLVENVNLTFLSWAMRGGALAEWVLFQQAWGDYPPDQVRFMFRS